MLISTSCPACGLPGSAPCADCAASIRRGQPITGVSGVDQVIAAMSYQGAARDVVLALKYRHARCVIPWIADCIAARVRSAGIATHTDLVTWVPAAGSSRRRRGFDQGELLASRVAKQLCLPARSTLVRKNDQRQTGAARSVRLAGPNLASRPHLALVGASVLIIDDVVTTGASLRIAARELHACGAGTLHAAVAASTPSTHLPHGAQG